MVSYPFLTQTPCFITERGQRFERINQETVSSTSKETRCGWQQGSSEEAQEQLDQ